MADVWGESWLTSWGDSWAQSVAPPAPSAEDSDITFYATTRRRRNIERLQMFEGASITVEFDFTSWAEDNGNVTAVTWNADAGILIANDSLSGNIAQAQLTPEQSGRSLIKLTAISANDIDIRYIDVLTRSLANPSDDYGLMRDLR